MSSKGQSATKKLSSPPSDEVTFTLFVDGALWNTEDNCLSIESDFKLDTLCSKLKRAADIPESVTAYIYRYSKSSGAYRLISNEDDIKALLRAAKVKRHFLFNIVIAKVPSFRPQLSLRAVRRPVSASDSTTSSGAVVGEGSNGNTPRDSFIDSPKNVSKTAVNNINNINKIDDKAAAAPKAQADAQEVKPAAATEEASPLKDQTDRSLLLDTAYIDAIATAVTEKLVDRVKIDIENMADRKLDEKLDVALSKAVGMLRLDKATNKIPSNTTSNSGSNKTCYHHAKCDQCGKWIDNIRYKCLVCSDFDLCSKCMDDCKDSHTDKHSFVRMRSVDDYIPAGSKQSLATHATVVCDGPCCVSKHVIKGDRYTCTVCKNVDFCSKCMNLKFWKHDPSHLLELRTTPDSQPVLFNEKVRKQAEAKQAETADFTNDAFKDYCAKLEGFEFVTADPYSGSMQWLFTNVGSKVWPKGTLIQPAYAKAAYQSLNMVNPELEDDVKPGETARLTNTFTLGKDNIDAVFELVTPSGVTFAKCHYYAGMKPNGLVLPGAYDEANQQQKSVALPSVLSNVVVATTSASASCSSSGLDSSEVKMFELPKESPKAAAVVDLSEASQKLHELSTSESEMFSDSECGTDSYTVINAGDWSDADL